MQRFRFLSHRLETLSGARLILLTGAHQVGKTSLARKVFPQLKHLELDDFSQIHQREAMRAVAAEDWEAAVGPAILDEAQQEPRLFETLKAAFDAGQVQRTVLICSPRALGLYSVPAVPETLTSRAFVCELWPLLASELAHPGAADPPAPLLDRLLRESGPADEIFAPRRRRRWSNWRAGAACRPSSGCRPASAGPGSAPMTRAASSAIRRTRPIGPWSRSSVSSGSARQPPAGISPSPRWRTRAASAPPPAAATSRRSAARTRPFCCRRIRTS
jgi:hypothetical protein